jgi:hypothetical protein
MAKIMKTVSMNFCGRYSPRRTLASFTITRHWSLSCDFRLQFLTPIVFKSFSAESSHLIAGLPTRRVPSEVPHFYIGRAHSRFPLVSPGFCYVVLDVSVRLQSLKASRHLRLFMGWDWQPHAQPPTYRTWVSLFSGLSPLTCPVWDTLPVATLPPA